MLLAAAAAAAVAAAGVKGAVMTAACWETAVAVCVSAAASWFVDVCCY